MIKLSMSFLGWSLALLCLSANVCVNAKINDDILSKLRVMYPNTNFQSVEFSEIDGLFEVKMGKNIAYTNKDGRYFLFGHLFDMQTQSDLTEQRHKRDEPIQKMMWPEASLSQAIKTVKGNGSRKIAVFSDPDCPYCKRLEANLAKVENITIYTFMYPLEGLHPEAKSKAISIWCADNPAQAWTDYLLMGKPPKLATCQNPIDQNIVLGTKLGVMGTPMMVDDQNRTLMGAASSEEIERWLAEGAAK